MHSSIRIFYVLDSCQCSDAFSSAFSGIFAAQDFSNVTTKVIKLLLYLCEYYSSISTDEKLTRLGRLIAGYSQGMRTRKYQMTCNFWNTATRLCIAFKVMTHEGRCGAWVVLNQNVITRITPVYYIYAAACSIYILVNVSKNIPIVDT